MSVPTVDPGLAERFWADGFLAVPDLVEPTSVAEAAGIIDGLFVASSRRRPHWRSPRPPGPQTEAKLAFGAALAPALGRTALFRALVAVAGDLLGPGARYRIDHIADLPRGAPGTPWHQDRARSRRGVLQRRAHFWVPLQPVDEESGCLAFARGSHARGLLPHVTPDGGTYRRQCELPSDVAVTPCPLPIGGVTVHQHDTLHSSFPNVTLDHRLAWLVQFVAAPGPVGRAAGAVDRYATVAADRWRRRASP